MFLMAVTSFARVIRLRSGDHENVAFLRDFRFVEESNGLGLIVVPFQQGLKLRQAVGVRAVQSVFTAAGNETNFANAFQILEERTGETFLGQRLCFFATATRLDESCAGKRRP